MNKLDVEHPTLTTHPRWIKSDFSVLQSAEKTISSNAKLEPAGRLLALVPANADYSIPMKRIWELATTTGMPIQLIGLCNDPAQEPSLRRELITISALIRDGRVRVDANVEIGANWVEVVKRIVQPGDRIVCFAEQQIGLFHRPLSQILESNLKMPVYILSGLTSPGGARSSHWFSQFTAWMGSIGIIAGTALLQIRIASSPQDWAQTTLLILSVIGEAWLIWGWNSLFS
jgi:hypothetical protein